MRMKITHYVGLICLLSLTAAAAVWQFGETPSDEALLAAACFAALSVLAQALTYKLAQGASGSIAFIPIVAVATVSPSWIAVASVATSVVIGEIILRRTLQKAVFNVSQHTLAVSVAILVFRGLGGRSLLIDQGTAIFLPYAALFATFLVLNTALVSGAIAASENRRVWQVWTQNSVSTIAYDLFSLPVVYVFALVYVRFGIAGLTALSIPLLGVRQLYKTNYQLQITNHELLRLMVAAIEARDPYTSGHSRRVSHYSKIIARAIGLSRREVERVGVAALLHDVGKIHEVFAAVLRKPEKLTPEELVVMQTHPIKSAELVQNVSHLKDVVAPIRHHHENWDGSGYPDGLAGDEIPFIARIIMIADTIDAMTTDRPYRKALGEADVRRELIRLRGKQFDPLVCDVLLRSPLYSLLFSTGSPMLTPQYSPVLTVGSRRRALQA